MVEFSLAFAVSAFVAGLFTFLAPCTLPLVPGYLSFISGVKDEDLENPDTKDAAKKKIFKNGVFFMLGFTVIFVLFGTLAGLFGEALRQSQDILSIIGGILVIIFGLFMVGAFKLSFLQGEKRMRMPKWLEIGKPSSSLIIGGTFAVGWTPCVGPILGSILALAAAGGSALQGALLLLVFSAGLALPFILIAFGYSNAQARIKRYFELAKKYRVPIFILFGIVIGFLVWLAVISIIGQFSGGFELLQRSVGENALSLTDALRWPLIALTSLLLAWWSYKKPDIDVISVVGGMFLIPLGVILLNQDFGLVIQYGFELFHVFEYDAILDRL